MDLKIEPNMQNRSNLNLLDEEEKPGDSCFELACLDSFRDCLNLKNRHDSSKIQVLISLKLQLVLQYEISMD